MKRRVVDIIVVDPTPCGNGNIAVMKREFEFTGQAAQKVARNLKLQFPVMQVFVEVGGRLLDNQDDSVTEALEQIHLSIKKERDELVVASEKPAKKKPNRRRKK